MTSDMVLVIPQVVIIGESAIDYHPFLHQLPHEFNYLSNLLKRIGVTNDLNLKHMQIVLESAYKCTEGKQMDPNTNQCVLKALKFIYKTLRTSKKMKTKARHWMIMEKNSFYHHFSFLAKKEH